MPWPFDQPRNCATFTTSQVLCGEPILLVSHDADDHAWQFIGRTGGNASNARVVSLEEMVRLDSTILDVSDLPPGWQAVRDGMGEPWRRRPRAADRV